MLRRVLDHFLGRLAGAPEWSDLGPAVAKSHDKIVISNLRGGGVPALLALLTRERRPILVIASSLERAEALTDGAAFFGAAPLIFPPFETLPFETSEPALHIAASRARVLARLAAMTTSGNAKKDSARDASQPPPLIVAPADSLIFRVLPREGLAEQIVTIGWGEKLDTEVMARRLTAMGYAREALVESPGEFAIRGSIVDIYPPEADLPWRLDLFGEDIEQIRRFDPTTQRSQPRVDEIEKIEILACAAHAPKIDWLLAGRPLGSFFDLLPENALIVIDGPERVKARLARQDEVARRHWEDLRRTGGDEEGKFFVRSEVQPEEWLLNAQDIQSAMTRAQRIDITDLIVETEDEVRDGGSAISLDLSTTGFENVPAQFTQYVELIKQRQKMGYSIAIVCDNNGQVMRLDELLRENEISAIAVPESETSDQVRLGFSLAPEAKLGDVLLMSGELHEGLQSPPARVMIVTDREMFGRYKRRHIYRKAYHGRTVANPAEINRGDFVVHVEHGIGHFEGIRRQFIDGRMAEFLELTYLEGDKLLVPVEKLNLIQKYASADGKEPTLDKLGSKKWSSRRKKSMEAVRKMAGELLELYARRASAEGFAYSPDTTWQQEFEASFVYQETPDQLKAIADVKSDMMQLRPMDRLVCGDVGYGKTEVAIRAAFKALVEKRQVAILAPTTLLVSQHYNTFRERFAGYPFRVEMLSRFRTAAEQKKTIEMVGRGELDLIVGTHRLLSRDVKFKDLGLLVVDEEQRFGVAQKEKIKSLRSDVDILTLTATPIPRTLYLALSGIRDLSIITTPPANRLPIKTRTIHFDREAIEEAVLRELNRGGQVFFVHNRIESIQDVAQNLKEIVPHAKLAVAHGQMDEDQLEKLMIGFIEGKFDILVSTTIIENGIDIPNVNTIIINRADTFGLAQLYQLRGRVGRDVRQAYAYLILPPGQAITPAAIKRLEALEEFTDLGVGFSIAMRDMEIRGTGNILGREQHGAITNVGYEMYCKLLEEAVNEMRGLRGAEPLWPTEIKWPIDQYLPEEYIPVESQRIRFYKDLAGARTREDLDLLMEELVDRYGAMPPPSLSLVAAARLKVAAAAWRVDVIRPAAAAGAGSADTVRITAPLFATELGAAITEAAGRVGGAARGMFTKLTRSGTQVTLYVREREDEEEMPAQEMLAALADLFEALPEFDAEGAMPPSGPGPQLASHPFDPH